MSFLYQKIVDNYNTIWDLRDRRVDDWFLMSSPLPTLVLCLTYVMIVKVWGPNLMKNRSPFQLRNVLIFYNLFQIVFSAWLFCDGISKWWSAKYKFRCQPMDYSDDPLAIGIARGCWFYYFSKFTDFFDTFFFVLRKKNNQISLLHVVHHGIMPMSVWFGVRFTPGGHAVFFGILNSFVHVIMYFYYTVAAMGPKYSKFIWWKKYLTVIQMIQFVAIFTHAFQLFFIECNFPIIFAWWIGGHGVLFFILFSDFFLKSFINKKGTGSHFHTKFKGHLSQNGGIQKME